MNKVAAVLCSIIILCAVCCRNTFARGFELALPGYTFNFPRDFASHDNYKTEWWYYTGHLEADDGTKYGYELTFFRIAMDVPDGVKNSPWTVDNAYMAHFAVSDIGSQQFFHRQKLNRAGLQFAGAEDKQYKVWNENWSAMQQGGVQHLRAVSPDYKIDLNLTSKKAPVIHGENGVSQKAGCRGCASHYFSFTRLFTDGQLTAHGKTMHVKGLSWMDHEFGSNQLTSDQVGWDWFSIQLDDNTELMLYAMRRKDKSIDPHSSGTFVESSGRGQHLAVGDYLISSQGSWHSNETGATYPMGWKVTVPARNLSLTITADMKNQELTKQNNRDVTYWEGACTVNGTAGGKPVRGQAYVEMTGYASAFSSNI